MRVCAGARPHRVGQILSAPSAKAFGTAESLKRSRMTTDIDGGQPRVVWDNDDGL